jgi:hypothetical protein
MNIGKNQPGKVVRAEHEQARDAHIVVSIPKAPGSLVELGLFLGKREVRRKMFVVWQKSWSNGFAGLVVTATMGLDGCQKVTYSGPSDVRSEALLAEVVTRIKGFCDALDF